jgi:hypothetical protein
MEKAIESQADPFFALLDWRNTPSEQLKLSPNQILFGRRTRTRLPMTDMLLTTPNTETTMTALGEQRKSKQNTTT